jgi:hypothetical protein
MGPALEAGVATVGEAAAESPREAKRPVPEATDCTNATTEAGETITAI